MIKKILIYLSATGLLLFGTFSSAHARYYLKIPCELKPNGHYNIDQYQFERMTAPHTPKDEDTRIRSF